MDYRENRPGNLWAMPGQPCDGEELGEIAGGSVVEENRSLPALVLRRARGVKSGIVNCTAN